MAALQVQCIGHTTQSVTLHISLFLGHWPKPVLCRSTVVSKQAEVPSETRLTVLMGGPVHSASGSLLPREVTAQVPLAATSPLLVNSVLKHPLPCLSAFIASVPDCQLLPQIRFSHSLKQKLNGRNILRKAGRKLRSHGNEVPY